MTSGAKYWLLRWPLFNFAVGAVGLISTALLEISAQRSAEPGEDVIEPLTLMAGALLFGFLANIGYRIMSSNAEDDATRSSEASFVRKRGFRRALKLWCAAATLPAWFALLLWILPRPR